MKQKLQELLADKKRLIIFGIYAGIAVLFIVAGVLIFKTPQGISAQPAEWQNYSSDELGFSVWHPTDWNVTKELAESGPDILISDKNRSAFP